MNALEKQLVSLQKQVEHLNTEVATLLALTSVNQHTAISATGRPLIERTTSHMPTAQVGINRYRQLANE